MWNRKRPLSETQGVTSRIVCSVLFVPHRWQRVCRWRTVGYRGERRHQRIQPISIAWKWYSTSASSSPFFSGGWCWWTSDWVLWHHMSDYVASRLQTCSKYLLLCWFGDKLKLKSGTGAILGHHDYARLPWMSRFSAIPGFMRAMYQQSLSDDRTKYK